METAQVFRDLKEKERETSQVFIGFLVGPQEECLEDPEEALAGNWQSHSSDCKGFGQKRRGVLYKIFSMTPYCNGGRILFCIVGTTRSPRFTATLT